MQCALYGNKQLRGCLHFLEDALQAFCLFGTIGKNKHLIAIGTELTEVLL